MNELTYVCMDGQTNLLVEIAFEIRNRKLKSVKFSQYINSSYCFTYKFNLRSNSHDFNGFIIGKIDYWA